MQLNASQEALTGLQASQTYMDVIGNNIANVNTTAYKTQSARFDDMLSVMVSQGSPSNGTSLGTNPYQVGLGVGQGSIATITSQGSIMQTGRNTDLAIQGNGYFVINAGTTAAPLWRYTRDGSFGLQVTTAADATTTPPTPAVSTLVNSETGLPVQGWVASGTPPTITTTGTPTNLTISSANATGSPLVSWGVGANGVISAQYQDGTSATLGQIAMVDVGNPDGLQNAGGNFYTAGISAAVQPFSTAGTGDLGTIMAGALEGSNVDLSQQFAQMIQAQQGFNSNTKVLSADDNLINALLGIMH